MHNLENKSKFIVVINGYFTRDGQVFCPEDLEIPHNEEDYSEEFYNRYEQDDDWCDICHKDIYLGMYEWLSDDIAGLLTYVSKKHGYPEGILQAYVI